MTATWTRFVQPSQAALPMMGGPLVSESQSGKIQTRSTQNVGRTWEEVYPPLRITTDPNARALYTQAMNFYRNGTRFLIDHRAFRVLLGPGGGAPVVLSANQVGTTLTTSGWPASANILDAGDVFTIAGLPLVYEVTGPCSTNGSGQASLPISPPLFPGGSPAAGAALTLNIHAGTSANVLFTCVIKSITAPRAGPEEWYQGLAVVFQESVG